MAAIEGNTHCSSTGLHVLTCERVISNNAKEFDWLTREQIKALKEGQDVAEQICPQGQIKCGYCNRLLEDIKRTDIMHAISSYQGVTSALEIAERRLANIWD